MFNIESKHLEILRLINKKNAPKAAVFNLGSMSHVIIDYTTGTVWEVKG